jgi:hypothetical protein
MFIKDLRNQGVIIQPKTGYLKYVWFECFFKF